MKIAQSRGTLTKSEDVPGGDLNSVAKLEEDPLQSAKRRCSDRSPHAYCSIARVVLRISLAQQLDSVVQPRHRELEVWTQERRSYLDYCASLVFTSLGTFLQSLTQCAQQRVPERDYSQILL